MTDVATYLEDEIMQWCFDGTAFDAAPTTLYVALHTGDPSENGSANEVSGGSYAREGVSSSGWTVTGNGPATADNDNQIVFTTATADWGTVSHVSLWDASTGGNCLWQGALDSSQTVNSGDQFQFAAGDLNIQID